MGTRSRVRVKRLLQNDKGRDWGLGTRARDQEPHRGGLLLTPLTPLTPLAPLIS